MAAWEGRRQREGLLGKLPLRVEKQERTKAERGRWHGEDVGRERVYFGRLPLRGGKQQKKGRRLREDDGLGRTSAERGFTVDSGPFGVERNKRKDEG